MFPRHSSLVLATRCRIAQQAVRTQACTPFRLTGWLTTEVARPPAALIRYTNVVNEGWQEFFAGDAAGSHAATDGCESNQIAPREKRPSPQRPGDPNESGPSRGSRPEPLEPSPSELLLAFNALPHELRAGRNRHYAGGHPKNVLHGAGHVLPEHVDCKQHVLSLLFVPVAQGPVQPVGQVLVSFGNSLPPRMSRSISFPKARNASVSTANRLWRTETPAKGTRSRRYRLAPFLSEARWSPLLFATVESVKSH